jgi:hypothetical protein
MAQQTTVKWVDDLDGSEAVETVSFSLGKKAFEIDLSDENVDKINEALAPFIDAGREVKQPRGRQASPAARTQSGRPTSREDSILIRKWARERGHEIADRGRIPGKILEAYRAER